jgi:hypothetical protein
MKSLTSKRCIVIVLPLLLVIFSLSFSNSADDGVVQTIKNATAPLDEMRFHPVLPNLENTVLVKTGNQERLFRTETRKDKMERYRCSLCHNNKDVTVTRAADMAHGDIVVVHGREEDPLDCLTCHDENERDFLVTENGVRVDMDHSYQMCGQCHFRERRDWVGGAHGKRVSFWAGERIVKNCTSCHDPHSPRFEKRWPVTYSPPFD